MENHTINVGVMSYGMSGSIFHCPSLHVHPKFNIKKILQRNSDSAKLRYPYVDIVKSFDELLSDTDIDLLIVNTPDNTHYEFVKAALDAGKHVVVEKPFTIKIHEGEELIRLAEKRGKVLSVYHNRRWDGDFLTIKKLIADKTLGRLVEFESNFSRFRNFIVANTWKEDPRSQSGTLYNLGSHLIDQALVLFGMPDAVSADIRIMRTGGGVDDYFLLQLFYQEVKVILRATYLACEPMPRFVLHGTEGSYIKWGIDPQEEALKQGKYPEGSDWGQESAEQWGILNTTVNNDNFRGTLETTAGSYIDYYANIADAIVFGKPLAVTAHQALDTIRIIEAAQQSHEQKKIITVK